MRIAVLGGLGLQGRAAIADLVASAGVEQVVCVDTARVPSSRASPPPMKPATDLVNRLMNRTPPKTRYD